MQRHHTIRSRLLSLIVAGSSALTACGDDGETVGVLAVEMSDFTYGGLPDEVGAGTRIEVGNTSASELHEFVAYRLDDDDDRGADDIVADVAALVAGGPPVTVLLAAPGDEQIAVVGDGTLTEPGRYLILCAIPTGADAGTYLAAAATSDGPPQVDGGPPHFVNGMFAEITVTG
jgi:uncharacterized cupredoxin-like copper-binding protein